MEPEKSILKEFISGGWVVSIIGAVAMCARLLHANKNMSYVEQFKKIITAAIAATIAWFVLEQTDVSSLTKAITYGIIGVISPEVITGIVRIGEKFAKNPDKFIKK